MPGFLPTTLTFWMIFRGFCWISLFWHIVSPSSPYKNCEQIKLEMSEDLSIALLWRYLRKTYCELKIGNTEKNENWEKEKWRNKGMNKQQQPDSGTQDTSACCPRVYQVSTFKASQFLRKVWRKILKFENWRERKINEEIKGQVSNSSLIPVYTIHLPTVQVCTKFQSSRPHSSWEKCDEKF